MANSNLKSLTKEEVEKRNKLLGLKPAVEGSAPVPPSVLEKKNKALAAENAELKAQIAKLSKGDK